MTEPRRSVPFAFGVCASNSPNLRSARMRISALVTQLAALLTTFRIVTTLPLTRGVQQ